MLKARAEWQGMTDLLLHDGRGSSDPVPMQAGIDGVPRPLKKGPCNAFCTGCHCRRILTAQLLHQLSKLGSQVGTCNTARHEDSLSASSG